MNRPLRSGSSIQNVFVWLLLALFAMLSMLLLAMGAQVYRQTVLASEDHSAQRVLNAVVRTAVWSEDGNGTFSVENNPELGAVALTMALDYDGDLYYRRLFCRDGYLMESFSSAEAELNEFSGEILCEAGSFEPSIENNLLTIRVTDARGQESTLCVALRTGGASE